MKNSRGFTLIELLIVIAITGIVGSILVAILSSTLRGASKGDIAAEVRSEGNYVITSMARDIQSASTFQGASVGYSGYTSGPSICNDTFTYKSLRFNQTPSGSLIVGCWQNAANPRSFASINSTLVEVSSCSLTCFQDSLSDPPTVKINFTLTQVSGNSFQEHKASIDFSTSVKMRNSLE